MSLPPSGEIPQGAIRFNTDSQKLEFYAQGEWWVMSTDTPNLGNGSTSITGSAYSTMLTSPGTVKTPEGGFRGVANYSSAGDRSEGVGGLTFTPVPPISFSTSVRIYDNNGVTKGRVNSNSYVQHSTNAFVTLVSGSGTINTIDTVRTDNASFDAGFVAIEVDGVLLSGNAVTITPAQQTPGVRGVFMGGQKDGSGVFDIIDYVNIASTGNAVDFGNLLAAEQEANAFSSSTRGFHFGGDPADNEIETIVFASTGNATDFGDLTTTSKTGTGLANATRGIAYLANGNVINYVTMAATGTAVDFGDATFSSGTNGMGCASPTRGVFGAAFVSPATVNTLDFITIATLGDAQDFGDLSISKWGGSGASNATRGIFMNGYVAPVNVNNIEYITISTGGNSVNFGDSTQSNSYTAGSASATRMINGGGGGPITNIIDYVEIPTQGNAVDFGDLTQDRRHLEACSNGHGGL